MTHAASPGPGLWARLLSAGIDAAVSAAACVSLALVLARDFDRLRRGRPWPESRFARGLRLGSLLSAAAAGLYIAMVTLPAIHRWIIQGFCDVLDGSDVVMILCGYGFLGAGMAARAIVGPPAGEAPLRSRPPGGIGALEPACALGVRGAHSLPDPLLILNRMPHLLLRGSSRSSKRPWDSWGVDCQQHFRRPFWHSSQSRIWCGPSCCSHSLASRSS